jgi:REP element-mobilizing transposase RayT
MCLNKIGKLIQSTWSDLPRFYSGVDVDVFTIMPNHIHGIIILTDEDAGLVGAGPCACPVDAKQTDGRPRGAAPTNTDANEQSQEPSPPDVSHRDKHPFPMSLSDVVHRFKSLTTTRYWKAFLNRDGISSPGKLWQRNYYEHVIRSDDALRGIREYIVNNPQQWDLDRENPAAHPPEANEPWEV